MSARLWFFVGFLVLLSPLALIRIQSQWHSHWQTVKPPKYGYGLVVGHISQTEPWEACADDDGNTYTVVGAVYLWEYREGKQVGSRCYHLPGKRRWWNFKVGEEVETITFIEHEPYARELIEITVKRD